MKNTIRIGDRVRVKVKGPFEGRTGIVGSIGKRALPYGVVLDGDKFETDFKSSELEIEATAKCIVCGVRERKNRMLEADVRGSNEFICVDCASEVV